MAATDRFSSSLGPWPAEQLSDPAGSSAAISPSDSADLAQIPKAIYVGVTGDITMKLKNDSASVLFKAVPVGVLPVRPVRIYATGTTATNIVALN
jgi:hypothetical protein